MNDQIQVKRKGILVVCGDVRHRPMINTLLDDYFGPETTVDDFDCIMVPGGVHFMAEPGTVVRDFMLGQIMKHAGLHNLSMVVIVLSDHCGAYGDQPKVTDEQEQHAYMLASKLEELGLNVVILANKEKFIVHKTPTDDSVEKLQ